MNKINIQIFLIFLIAVVLLGFWLNYVFEFGGIFHIWNSKYYQTNKHSFFIAMGISSILLEVALIRLKIAKRLPGVVYFILNIILIMFVSTMFFLFEISSAEEASSSLSLSFDLRPWWNLFNIVFSLLISFFWGGLLFALISKSIKNGQGIDPTGGRGRICENDD